MDGDATIKIREYLHAALLDLRGVVPRVRGKKPTVSDVIDWLLQQHGAGVVGPVRIVEQLRRIEENTLVTRQHIEDQGAVKAAPKLIII
jgi:hypothetical protein